MGAIWSESERAERRAQLIMKRLDDLIGPDIDPVGDHDYLMAIREAQLRMEKLDDLIGPDIDPVGDHDDLMATGSLESNDSGVSMKSDRSKTGLIDFKDRVSPRPDFSSPEKKHIVSDDKDLVKSPDVDERRTRKWDENILRLPSAAAPDGLFISLCLLMLPASRHTNSVS